MQRALLALMFFASATAFAADDKENEKWLEKIAGSDSVSAVEKAGEPAPTEFLKSFSGVTIKGNKLTISFKENAKSEDRAATITIDATKKPLAIDLKAEDGPKKNETYLGIVELTDDTVKLCWGDGPNAKRPVDATSTKENKNFMITLKRIKD